MEFHCLGNGLTAWAITGHEIKHASFTGEPEVLGSEVIFSGAPDEVELGSHRCPQPLMGLTSLCHGCTK